MTTVLPAKPAIRHVHNAGGNSVRKPPAPTATARAVLYLRVSDPKQLHTDYDPEGISLPAQRKSCLRKAEQLGLEVVGEYVEPGRSGRETEHRLEFQKMLARIKTDKDVSHVIVHKLSRLARNRIDEALVMDQFRRRGVSLVSATEPIDATPEGQFMQGVLSAMAQFRSQQDGQDIAYKMGEKAKNGGTLGRAPIGYLNVRELVNGHEIRTVALDPERAQFIKPAFEMYRDGATLNDICRTLGERGFVSRPTSNRPARPLADSTMANLLRDPYYLGYITYKGELYPGRHQPLIDRELFDAVQAATATRGVTGTRRRIHDHLLKGMLWCGQCHDQGLERRMILNHTKGKQQYYWHYFCNGRTFEDQPHLHVPYIGVELIETALARYYRHVGFTAEFVVAMNQAVDQILADFAASDVLARQQAENQLARLEQQEQRLIDLALDGTVPADAIRDKLAQIQSERDGVERQLISMPGDINQGAVNLREALKFLENPAAWYNHPLAPEQAKKQLNAAIFSKIYIHLEPDTKEPAIAEAVYADGLQQLKDLETTILAAATAHATSEEPAQTAWTGTNGQRRQIAEPDSLANRDTSAKLSRTATPNPAPQAAVGPETGLHRGQTTLTPGLGHTAPIAATGPENAYIPGQTTREITALAGVPLRQIDLDQSSSKAAMVPPEGVEPSLGGF